MSAKDSKIVLAYDLGGTKVAVGAVNSAGKVLHEIRVPVEIEKGKAAVIRQLGDLGKKILSHYPKIRAGGIGSAGPLDSTKGILLDPTNFSSNGETWGKVPLAKLVSSQLGIPIALENDAAAAVLAERWVGWGKNKKNIMVLTLGTGLGAGIIVNGELVRARDGLHPEAGHMIIHQGDQSAPCGCGNLGCAEAFLSGRGFTRRNRPRFAHPEFTAVDIANLARKRDPRALAAFEEYAMYMAVALHNYAVIYAPEIVVLTGSFAATADLFLESTEEHLKKLLIRRRVGFDLMPKIKISKLDNQAGLIGGGYVALHHHSDD
jgi:glucokinase